MLTNADPATASVPGSGLAIAPTRTPTAGSPWRMSHAAVEAALFTNVYRDRPVLQLPFRTNDGLVGFTTNAGSATAKGAELEVGGLITDGLRVGLTYSYTDSTNALVN